MVTMDSGSPAPRQTGPGPVRSVPRSRPGSRPYQPAEEHVLRHPDEDVVESAGTGPARYRMRVAGIGAQGIRAAGGAAARGVVRAVRMTVGAAREEDRGRRLRIADRQAFAGAQRSRAASSASQSSPEPTSGIPGCGVGVGVRRCSDAVMIRR